ncbi:MAG: Clp protease N-terminal domain-containing protein, partial [Miltoncostaeaceae bacterium]
MPVDKPTERAAEALGAAQALAETRGNQLVEPEHLLLALLDQPEGVVQPIVERAGADPATLRAAAQAAVEARPTVSGAQVSVEFSPAV